MVRFKILLDSSTGSTTTVRDLTYEVDTVVLND